MTATKRSLAALLIALTLFISVYKPQDHEQHAESPTVETEASPKEQAEATTFVDGKLQAPRPKPVSTVQPSKPVQAVQPAKQAPPKPVTYTFQASHYVSTCSGCSGTTASGYNVKNTIYYEGMRILAADKSIPLYTKMHVTYPNGTSFIGIVIDRGGAIKTGKLDVLVASYDEAIRLGRQQVTVEFLN